LGKQVEYADNIDGKVVGIMLVERGVITHTSFFEDLRVDAMDLTEPEDFLSKRINASKPLYFY